MNLTTTAYITRDDGREMELDVEATVLGSHGQIDEICDVVARCGCGANMWPTLTRDEERRVEAAIEQQVERECENAKE